MEADERSIRTAMSRQFKTVNRTSGDTNDKSSRDQERTVLRSKWQDKIRQTKSCLPPSFCARRKTKEDIGNYSGIEEWERKWSDTTITSTSAGTYTPWGSKYPELGSPVGTTVDISTPALNDTTRYSKSLNVLSRFNTRITSTTNSGYSKIKTDPEEKAARKAGRRDRRKKKMGRWMGSQHDHSYEAARFVDQNAHAMASWRYAMAYSF